MMRLNTCPITKEAILQPVYLVDGERSTKNPKHKKTPFELEAIFKWLVMECQTSYYVLHLSSMDKIKIPFLITLDDNNYDIYNALLRLVNKTIGTILKNPSRKENTLQLKRLSFLLDGCHTLRPTDYRLPLYKANIYDIQKNRQGAISEIEKSLSLCKPNPFSFLLDRAGTLYSKNKMYDKAEKYFQEAIEKDDKNEVVFIFHLARLLRKHDKPKEAIKQFLKAKTLINRHPSKYITKETVETKISELENSSNNASEPKNSSYKHSYRAT